MSTTATYRVEGMTCDHCVRSVTAEVSEISGVTDVQVDLTSGTVTVTSDRDRDLDLGDLAAAVVQAGYELRS